MAKNKVLQVQGGMNKGGVESIIMSWYRNIDTDKIQFDFTTCFEHKCPYDDEILERGGNIYYIPPRSKVGNIKHIYYLYKCIKEHGPYDAVHSHMNFHGGVVAIAAKLAGCKNIVMHAHNTKDDGNGLKRKIEVFILKNTMKFLSDKFLACGEEAGFFIYGKHDFEVISNSVDRRIFKAKDKKNDKNLINLINRYNLGEKIILGNVGRFSSQKNHRYMLDIMRELKARNFNFKFVFIGDGELKCWFEKEIIRFGLEENVLMLGLVDNVNEWLNIIDVLIMPSLYEGLPVVVIEAQSCGTQCILSKNITRESDLGIGLIKYLDIEKISLIQWINEIEKINIDNKILDNDMIELNLIKKGFNLKANIEKMKKIYLIK
ncbi:glycosyltransferase [Clostridium perfringens]